MADVFENEIIFSRDHDYKALSRAVKQGVLKRLARGVYTTKVNEPDESVLRRHIPELVTYYAPGGVVSHRSVAELGAGARDVFITRGEAGSRRTVRLPGLRLHFLEGPGPLDSDLKEGAFYIASRARAALENLVDARERGGVKKTLTRAELEDFLVSTDNRPIGAAMEALYAEAETVAPALGMTQELSKLKALCEALASGDVSRIANPAHSVVGRRVRGKSFDHEVLMHLERVMLSLRGVVTPDWLIGPDNRQDGETRKNLSLLESYCSNYIEGTRFHINAARDIVLHNAVPAKRPKDGHDVLNLYHILTDPVEMTSTPDNPDEFIETLKRRHSRLADKRPEVNPGEFKTTINQAGQTVFVLPEQVEGTLREFYDIYRQADTPLGRAILMAVAVSEIHPFEDGNGRVSRIMMNAELDRADKPRIIIPNVLRGEYINSLRIFSRLREVEVVGSFFVMAQTLSSALPFAPTDVALRAAEHMGMTLEPDEGEVLYPPGLSAHSEREFFHGLRRIELMWNALEYCANACDDAGARYAVDKGVDFIQAAGSGVVGTWLDASQSLLERHQRSGVRLERAHEKIQSLRSDYAQAIDAENAHLELIGKMWLKGGGPKQAAEQSGPSN